jgi:hypothetical protein
MDQKYESNYQRRNDTKSPSYEPLQVADRAAATQAVFAAQQRQEALNRQNDELYQRSVLRKVKTDGQNAVTQAKELTQLGELSQSLASELTKMERARGEAAALDQEMIEYERGLPEQQMAAFDQKEAELAGEGAAIDTASFQMGEETQDASIERAGRKLSGWRAYGAMRAQARLRGEDYGTQLDVAKQEFSIPDPQNPDGPPITMMDAEGPIEFNQVLTAWRKQYMSQFPGMRPELKEKYMYEPMRRAEAQLRGEWKQQQKIKLEEEKTGYIGSELSAAGAVKDPNVLAQAVIELQATEAGAFRNGIKGVNDNIKAKLLSMDLSDEQIDALYDTVIPAGPHKGKTWGSVYGGTFGSRTAMKSTMSTRQNTRVQIQLDEQNRRSEQYRANILKDRANGIWHSDADLYRIAQENNINITPNLRSTINQTPIDDEVAKANADSLIESRGENGFLTRAEFDALPQNIRADYKDKVIDSPTVKENEETVKRIDRQTKLMVKEAMKSEYGPDGSLEDDDADETYVRASEFYQQRFLELRRDNPEMTVGQAYAQIRQEMKDEFNPATWETDKNAYLYGNRQFDASLSENRLIENANNQLSDNPYAITSQLPGFGTADDPKSSLGKLVAWNEAGGIGNNTGKYIPNEYYRVAELIPDMDVYDVVRAQLNAAGITPTFEKPAAAQYVDMQPSDVQRLLKNMPTPSRGFRASLGGNSGVMKDQKQFLDLIASVESKGFGDYDAMNIPYTNVPYNSNDRLGRGLSSMTIGEVLQLQASNQVHAAGRYQFTNHQGTLGETIRLAGLTEADAFSPENQDRLALARARWRINQGAGMTGLRNEWVGLNAVPNQELRPFLSMFDKVDTSSPYNQPENMTPSVSKAVYTTGNIGPTSTGPHLDVKQVGGGRFAENELDNYVQVEDPEFGRIGLGELRQRTGGVGDNFDQHVARGSHGIDYGTHSGTKVFLQNGAQVVSSQPSAHGDILTIQLPDGRQFTFLHGTSN